MPSQLEGRKHRKITNRTVLSALIKNLAAFPFNFPNPTSMFDRSQHQFISLSLQQSVQSVWTIQNEESSIQKSSSVKFATRLSVFQCDYVLPRNLEIVLEAAKKHSRFRKQKELTFGWIIYESAKFFSFSVLLYMWFDSYRNKQLGCEIYRQDIYVYRASLHKENNLLLKLNVHKKTFDVSSLTLLGSGTDDIKNRYFGVTAGCSEIIFV